MDRCVGRSVDSISRGRSHYPSNALESSVCRLQWYFHGIRSSGFEIGPQTHFRLQRHEAIAIRVGQATVMDGSFMILLGC
jgi:hypothetical protein